ncbi:MAG: sigma-70 family polymerase sigma factor [Flavipsychrobacter sp.]|nr:sigma-70 family polymerase sigma factor [Flavipsychrobacter sp.]
MKEQFLHIISQKKEALFRICRAYATSHEDAKDLLQDVLLNIWNALDGFQHRSSIDTWMYRIALNVCMRARQKNSKYKDRYLTTEGQKLESLQVADVPAKQYHALYHCIYQLGESDRSVVLLYLEDLPYKEIAEITGLNENNIAVKMTRIKTKLFNCLKKDL